MYRRKPILLAIAVTGGVLLAACAAIFFHYQRHSDELWDIVSQKCVPNQQQHHDPTPCRYVDLPNGYVVLKDRNGPLQFLLLPVAKITGIESPQLLRPSTPNFIAEAWRARHYMEEKRGTAIPDSAVSLSVNAPSGRTQNQLHVHISCLRPDIRKQLNQLDSSLGTGWQTERLGEYEYRVRAVTRDEFKRMSPFIRIASEVPGAREKMSRYGIAVASLSGGRRALMVVKRNFLMLNRGTAEELQDHSCSILK